MVGLTFSTTPKIGAAWAILIADAIYERLTGEKGYFDTRIVFISESGPQDQAPLSPLDHGSGRRQPAAS